MHALFIQQCFAAGTSEFTVESFYNVSAGTGALTLCA
jgi:hypothetical protein